MPQLDFLTHPFASQMFWLFFSFGLLYFFATKLILPRIKGIKSNRSNTIDSALREANQLKDEALKANNSSSNYLNESKVKAEALISQALTRLKEKETAALSDAKRKLNRDLANISVDLVKYKASTQDEFSKVAVDLTKHILETNYGIVESDAEILNHIGKK